MTRMKRGGTGKANEYWINFIYEWIQLLNNQGLLNKNEYYNYSQSTISTSVFMYIFPRRVYRAGVHKLMWKNSINFFAFFD